MVIVVILGWSLTFFYGKIEFASLFLMLSAFAPGLHTSILDAQVSDIGPSYVSLYQVKQGLVLTRQIPSKPQW